jgi:hypothetical protein
MSTKGFRNVEPTYETPTDFVQGAASHTVVTEPPKTPPAQTKRKAGPKPWELANPRVKIVFSVRMDEPLHAKLAYVAERLPGTSMHSIMLQAANEKLDALIRELDK